MVEKVRKDTGGNEEERGDVRRDVWEVQGRRRRKDGKQAKASAKKQGGIGEHLEIYGGLSEGK